MNEYCQICKKKIIDPVVSSGVRGSKKYYTYYSCKKCVIPRIFKSVKKWRINNPLKTKAHRIVFINIRNGNLIKKPCKVCGKEKSEAHHEDYTKPLEVIWLCKKHHIEADKKLKTPFLRG